MSKPATYGFASRKAALWSSAAFALCLAVGFGLLWPVPVSLAAEETAQVDGIDNVVVQAPVTPVPDPQSQPDPEPTVPDVPAEPAPAPDYDNAWPIGAGEASSVVAELWADGTFVVDGAGEALAFASVEDVPWLAAGVADDIERVIFADKVEAPSLAHWFEGCSNLREVANVPADVEDLTRAFYDCPKLVELPDEFAFADEAVAEACFGFEEPIETLLATFYRGADENVLAYAWELDGRKLVNPDAPEPPVVEEPQDPAKPTEPVEPDAPEDPEVSETPADEPSGELVDELAEAPVEPEPAPEPTLQPVPEAAPELEPAPAPAPQEEAQVNITVPSSVSMMLNAEGDNAALIPVAAANRSERSVAIVGARLKRASQDLPGGSWSLTTESGSTTFVEDARFTPLGLEVAFDRPVILAAGDEGTMLVWHGAFTDYGMKQLAGAAADAGDGGFAYGSMIWIVAAA